MEYRVYTIRDNKADAYLQPFFMPNYEVAARAISDCVGDVSHNFHVHAQDFALYELGTFDDQTGEITSQPATHLINLIDLKSQLKED